MRPAITSGPAGPGECGDLGQTACRRQSGPPWRASRLIRCAADSAAPCSPALPQAHPPPCSPPTARTDPTRPTGSARSRPISRPSWRSTGTNSPRSRSRSASCASRSSPRSCWCAPAPGSPTPRRRRATRASPRKAAVDRAYALLLAEPQILVAWAAGVRRAGDHRRSGAGRRPERAAARPRLRHLARARPAQRDGACGRCAARPRRQSFATDADHAVGPHRRGRGAGRSAAARSCGCARSAASSTSWPNSARATRSRSTTSPRCAP